MAIEFKHNGKLWRADTVDEAIQLRNRLHLEDEVAIDSGEEPYTYRELTWTPDTTTELVKNAGPLQKRFLRILAPGASVISETIVKELRLDSEVSLAGVLSGLSKQLKKLDLRPIDLYSVEITWEGKEKTRHFKLDDQFRWAAAELGWPEKWPEK